MKCKWCGAAVSLNDEFCPYCGALNEPARKHIEDMKKFSADYSATKSEVLGNVEKQSGKHRKIIIIVILVLLNVLVLIGSLTMDDVRYYFQDMKIQAKAGEYSGKMAEFEQEEDFRAMSEYYLNLNLYSVEPTRHYDAVAEMARSLCKAEDSLYYLINDELQSYMTEGELLQDVAHCIGEFYATYAEKEETWRPECFSEKHLQTMEKMDSYLRSALKTYCKLSDEDLDRLPDMESQSILFVIGRSLGYYE